MNLKNANKAGYQGKFDAMRALGDKLMGKGGHAKDTILSKDNMNIPYTRPYKEGGRVESRQHMDNDFYERDKKLAERHQVREHKDFEMIKHRDHEDFEKRKKYEEAKERRDHSAFEREKRISPMMKDRMEEPMFKKGGTVKDAHKKGETKAEHKKHIVKKSKEHCYAAGGVAKIRLNEATSKGMPKHTTKGNLRSVYY